MKTLCLILILLLLILLFSYEGDQQSRSEELEYADEEPKEFNNRK